LVVPPYDKPNGGTTEFYCVSTIPADLSLPLYLPFQ
jgi:hypothetical protein